MFNGNGKVSILFSKKKKNYQEKVFYYFSNCLEEGDSDYLTTVKHLTEEFSKRSLYPPHYNEFIYRLTPTGKKNTHHLKVVHSYAERLIEQRKLTLKSLNINETEKVFSHLFMYFFFFFFFF